MVSQIDYNPAGGNGFEFLELMNISAQNIDLTGVHLRDGVDYNFPANTLLAPGGRLQVVGNLESFVARHGASAVLRPVGPFVGNLSNSGEHLLLVSDTQGTIKDFTYNNTLPWPTEADGGGYRLVLIAPQTNPNHNLAASWRGSTASTQMPGDSDAVAFTGDPTADSDGDGYPALIEYLLGTSDSDGRSGSSALAAFPQSFTVNGVAADYLTLTLTRHPAADSAIGTVEASSDITTWFADAAHVVLVNRERTGTGAISETWRAALPITPGENQFLRLRAQLR